MKKYLLSAVLLACGVLASNAQNVASNCYRGFVDVGYSFGLGDYDFGRVEINTSHGYQISPYFFVGAGLGLHFMSSYETPDIYIPLDVRDSQVDVPVFANARVNFTKKKVTPFVDVKAGTFVTNNGGLYLNIAVGCRIATNSRNAINVSVGYAFEKLEFQTFKKFTSTYSLDYTRYANKLDTESIGVKVGYEF